MRTTFYLENQIFVAFAAGIINQYPDSLYKDQVEAGEKESTVLNICFVSALRLVDCETAEELR